MAKKILFIINSLHKKSGIERVAIGIANKLTESHDDLLITVVNRDTNIHEVAYPINRGIEVLPLTGNLLSFISKLQRLIKKNSYDFIIVHNMGRLSLVCSLLSIPKGTKLISLEHGAFDSRPHLIRLLSRIQYKKIEQIICLTKHDNNSIRKFHKNTLIIPNFTEYPIRPPNTDLYSRRKIIAVGRLTKEKNLSHLLAAWKIASSRIPNWLLEIYGEGELENNLTSQIKTEKINNIVLKGAVSNIEDVYSNASFMVMSSKNEGLPMVLIEAQTFGLPLVSYNCPHGPKEIIQHGENGFLVENQNINQLAKYIVKLAQSRELLQRMSYSSLKAASKYQPEEIINTWINEVLK